MSKDDLTLDPSVRFARNTDWNLFKTFYVIGRLGGIGAAARSLNKTQPSVSIALKRLEEHIGAVLCVRTLRGIELTLQGHQVMAACDEMFRSIQSAQRAASAANAEISGRVYLRVISSLYLVPEIRTLFDEFHRKHPKIDMCLDVGSWRQVLNAVRSGDAELCIGFDDDDDSDLLYLPICDQETQIYCGPRHPLFGKGPVLPDALTLDPFVITHDEPIRYVRYREKYGLGRTVGSIADNLLERMWLINMGMGIGILPRPVVEASTFSSGLWPLLSDSSELVCRIHLIAHRKAVRSAPAQLLLDAAHAQLSALAEERSLCPALA